MTHPSPPLDAATLRALAAKWREEAEGVTAMGYSQQGDRMRDCADELTTLVAAAAPRPVESLTELAVMVASNPLTGDDLQPLPPAEARDDVTLTKAYVAGQMDAQATAQEKWKVGAGGPLRALSRRAYAEAGQEIAALRAQVQALTEERDEARSALDTARRQVSDNMVLAMVEADRSELRKQLAEAEQATRTAFDRAIALVEQMPDYAVQSRSDLWTLHNMLRRADVLTALRAIAPSEEG